MNPNESKFHQKGQRAFVWIRAGIVKEKGEECESESLEKIGFFNAFGARGLKPLFAQKHGPKQRYHPLNTGVERRDAVVREEWAGKVGFSVFLF